MRAFLISITGLMLLAGSAAQAAVAITVDNARASSAARSDHEAAFVATSGISSTGVWHACSTCQAAEQQSSGRV